MPVGARRKATLSSRQSVLQLCTSKGQHPPVFIFILHVHSCFQNALFSVQNVFCFQASQTFWQPVEDHTPDKVFTLNISANFNVFLAQSHINIVQGSIKRLQILLSLASSKDSSLLLMHTLVRDPRSIIASMLRAPSSWKAHLRNGPTMVHQLR